jgi:hypothetical protein
MKLALIQSQKKKKKKVIKGYAWSFYKLNS